MKSKKTLKLVILFLTIPFISCSEDDADNAVPLAFDKNAQLEIKEIKATSARFEVVSGSSQNLQVGIRKKGTSEFNFVSVDANNGSLESGTVYEAQLFVLDSNTQSPFELIEFITPLLDYIEFANSEFRKDIYIKSVPNFEHRIKLGINGQDVTDVFPDNFTLKLVSATNADMVWDIDYTLNNDLLDFTMPTDILINEKFNVAPFYLKYSLDGKEFFFQDNRLPDNKQYVFSVHDPKPSFLGVTFIKREFYRCNAPAYNLRFTGSFLNSFESKGLVIHDKMTVIITRVDNGEELLLDFAQEDQTSCLGFRRLANRINNEFTGLTLIHSNEVLVINYIEAIDGKPGLSSGDYTIQANFNNDDGDLRSTEPFEFTIPEL